MTVGICSRCSQEPIFKVSSKSGQLELRYSWYGQMSWGQMLPGQMSPWQLEAVLDVPRDLSLKFHQNRVSNSWDITDIEFLWVVGCAKSFLCQTQACVEVRLGFWQLSVCLIGISMFFSAYDWLKGWNVVQRHEIFYNIATPVLMSIDTSSVQQKNCR